MGQTQFSKIKFFGGTEEYFVKIIECDEGGYFAEVIGCPGCMAQGETLGEVQERIKNALKGWLQVLAEGFTEGFEEGE